jgi:hypothetical protein
VHTRPLVYKLSHPNNCRLIAQELLQLSTVPDEGAVAQLAAHGADPPFRVRAGGRIGG